MVFLARVILFVFAGFGAVFFVLMGLEDEVLHQLELGVRSCANFLIAILAALVESRLSAKEK